MDGLFENCQWSPARGGIYRLPHATVETRGAGLLIHPRFAAGWLEVTKECEAKSTHSHSGQEPREMIGE
jgi:hypothetical protein